MDLKHSWQEITPPLYSKIKATSGSLHHTFDSGFLYDGFINQIWFQIRLEPFDYLDPFYGPQSSENAGGDIEVGFDGNLPGLEIGSIFDLSDRESTFEDAQASGAFSNSLSVIGTRFRFGPLVDRKITLEMDYFLTNSDSYSMMTGTVDDHKEVSGSLKVSLDVKDPRVCVNKPKGTLQRITKRMDRRSYNIRQTEKVEENKYYTFYTVAVRDQQQTGFPFFWR